MTRAARILLVVLLLALPIAPASAVEPDEVLDDPRLELRAREISLELRCLVCQNQSIDDSNAPLARDLRLLVRERLKAGDTDRQVVDFVVARYGEFVLLRPRFAFHTLILWLGPPLVFFISIFALYRAYRYRAGRDDPVAAAPLSAAEKKKLKKLLDSD